MSDIRVDFHQLRVAHAGIGNSMLTLKACSLGVSWVRIGSPGIEGYK